MIEALLQIVYILLLLIAIAFLGVVAVMVVVCGYYAVVFRIDNYKAERRMKKVKQNRNKRKAK